MNGLIIGMDLCDSCTHISCQGQDTIWSFPTRIGKEPDSDVWRVAEESAGGALEGMVVEDKLLSLAMKDGTATIDGVRYEGLYLLKMFLKQVLAIPRQASGKEEIENLVITVPKLEVKLLDCLMYCADFLEIDRSRVHVISHAESFVYYVMSQKREVWSNQADMGKLAGVSRQTISLIERGDYSPSVTLALKLAKICRVTVEDIFIYAEDEEDE